MCLQSLLSDCVTACWSDWNRFYVHHKKKILVRQAKWIQRLNLCCKYTYTCTTVTIHKQWINEHLFITWIQFINHNSKQKNVHCISYNMGIEKFIIIILVLKSSWWHQSIKYKGVLHLYESHQFCKNKSIHVYTYKIENVHNKIIVCKKK